MTHKLAANENFEIVRGNQTVRVPFDATDPATPQTARLVREGEFERLDTRLAAVEGAVAGALKRVVVSVLPSAASADANTIYMVPRNPGETGNVYDEWMAVNGAWEKIGSTDVDLTDYAKTSEVTAAVAAEQTRAETAEQTLATALAGKVSKSGDTMTGGLTVPFLTVGNRRSGESVGEKSVSEGIECVASGISSHAEGSTTVASGISSHAEGYWVVASNSREHAQGSYNASHKASGNFGDGGNTLSSIGFGNATTARKNAVETMQDGKTFLLGVGGYDGTNPTGHPNAAQDLATVINAKVEAGDLRYALAAPTVASGAVTLDDRAVNTVETDSETASLAVVFPAAQSGRVRDFMMRLVVATGADAPTLSLPAGNAYEAPDGELPDLSELDGGGTMLIYFSEVAANRFYVKSEIVEEVA